MMLRGMAQAALLALESTTGSSVIVMRILLLIWAVFFVYLIVRIQKMKRVRTRMDQNMQVLQEECDPEKYIRLSEEFLSKKGIDELARAFVRMNMAVAYFDLGQVGRAKEMIEDVPEQVMDRNYAYRIVLRYNRFMFLLPEGDPEEMREAFREFEEEYKKLETASKSRNRGAVQIEFTGSDGKKRRANVQSGQLTLYQSVYQKAGVLLKMKLGDCSGAADFFEQCFKSGSTRNGQVHNMYYKAISCEKTGDYEECARCLDYVIENGKKLDIVKTAAAMKQRLSEMPRGGNEGMSK